LHLLLELADYGGVCDVRIGFARDVHRRGFQCGDVRRQLRDEARGELPLLSDIGRQFSGIVLDILKECQYSVIYSTRE
jgi:hypothetical protein